MILFPHTNTVESLKTLSKIFLKVSSCTPEYISLFLTTFMICFSFGMRLFFAFASFQRYCDTSYIDTTDHIHSITNKAKYIDSFFL